MPKSHAPMLFMGLLVVLLIVGFYMYQKGLLGGAVSGGASTSSTSAPASAPAATPQHLTFCEQDYAAHPVNCPAGKNLTINKFMYWRPGATCAYPQNPTQVFANCSGQDYTSAAQALVQGGNLVFTAPVNTLPGFNDPCPNIYKQIDIDYTCT